MKKYLLSFLLIFMVDDVFALVESHFENAVKITTVTGEEHIYFNEVKNTNADEYIISNSLIEITDIAEWQSWNPQKVYLDSSVSFQITDTTNPLPVGDFYNANFVIKDIDNLHNTAFVTDDTGTYVKIVRETNYQKVFQNTSGDFLENIRSKRPNDKMLSAMDRATNMNEINSIMNSSYHFNPMILMNPVKTINRSKLLDVSMEESGAGAKFNYITSNKLNDFGGRLYIGNKYNDFHFNMGLNFDGFSYTDTFNEFDGFVYGADVKARQYFDNLWVDGLLGFNMAKFKAEDIYVNNNVNNNPNGNSQYFRFGVGYDYTKIKDFVVTPFIGFMSQRSNIIDSTDIKTNMLAGINGKYSFVMDGIRYEYDASISSDEKANWNVGLNVVFLSVSDNAGASFGINAFKDEFATNYKISVNAKILF